MKTIENRIARTIVLVVSLMMSFPVFGQNADAVDLNLARRVGENFIKLNPDIKLSGKPGSLRRIETDRFPNLYIFNADEHGFIIVAGDKRMQPILAFSDEGTFDPYDMTPTAEMMVDEYDYMVDSLVHNNVRATDESVIQAWRNLENGFYETKNSNRDLVGPLIQTRWSQGGDYKQFCPWKLIGNKKVRAVTGCVPNAMAQMLYYYKNKDNIQFPQKTVERPFYSRNEKLKIEYGGSTIESAIFNYTDPFANTNAHPYTFVIGGWDFNTDVTILAAKMMRDCGIAVSCQYGLGESGALSAPDPNPIIADYIKSAYQEFKSTFGFPNAIIKKIVYPSKYDTDEMKKYIDNGHPIYIGYVENGVRHASIIDGYMSGEPTTFHFINGSHGDFYSILNHLYLPAYLIVLEPNKCKQNVGCLSGAKDQQSTNQIIYESVTKYHEYMDAMSVFLENTIKDIYWQDEDKGIVFWNLFQSLVDSSTGMITEDGIQQLINQSQLEDVSEEYIRDIAEGYNQSVLYWNEGYYSNDLLPEGYGGMIEYDTAAMRKAYEAQAYAESLGFNDVREMYDNAYEILEAEVGNQQTSVCASVTLQFSHKMTMTREAFNGTLQIFNGHESIPMEDILVDFRIEDQQGNDCTNLFQINTLSLDQITGISGDGSLAAQTNGTALVQFIPTKNAAPTEPKVYSFGGSFSFIDPFAGEGLTYPLYPVEITVNPSPDLYVDYFMQRDILGDDALTTDVVEPTVPAELGVIIHNQGAGMAKNVVLETAEPEIIDNEKGLAIDFAMYGASFNGSPRQLGLMEIPFGNIGSGQTAVGEWLFTSSLLGHFVSYTAHVIHNSSYGSSDLSLVSHLDIHELIHPIYAYGNLDDGINDFLVNDNPDAYDTPDSIYFSHGGKTSVGVVDGISFDHLVSPSDTIVTLTVVPSRVGWNYGLTDDPGMNQYNIVSCIRNNDNQVIPLNNVWLTFVTIPDGGDPVYENKLHIVDTIPVQQTTTYTLVFAKKPSNLRIFHGNEDEYWSNVANWEGYILPQPDDEVLINGICELDEDAEVFSLTVAENKSLTIPDGRILTVSGSLTNADASGLVIEEGGQLMHTNTGAQGTVQKNILPYTEDIKDGWYLVSSPLAGFTNVISVSDLLSNNYDLYYYDEPTHYWINQEYAANNFTELTNGKGYLYANSEEVMLGFEGELQSGSAVINVLLSYTDGIDLAGFNLVGNPYAHNVTSYSSVNVANGCYQINETKDDLVVSEIDEDNPLKPAEGFFVKATDVGASITFNPGRGETTNRSGSIRVELLDNGKLIDRLIVKREGEPLEKMSLNESRTKVFAMQDHREMAIVPCEGNEQPVNFKAAKNGTYTINVNTNGIEFNYLHLIDNFTGADVDLLALRQAQGSMSYTFEAKTSDYASRFRLVFSVCGDADGDSETFAFFSNGNWIIINNGEATLQVIDIHGHILSSETISGSCSKAIHAAPGVYIIRLINGENVKTQKIIIE